MELDGHPPELGAEEHAAVMVTAAATAIRAAQAVLPGMSGPGCGGQALPDDPAEAGGGWPW